MSIALNSTIDWIYVIVALALIIPIVCQPFFDKSKSLTCDLAQEEKDEIDKEFKELSNNTMVSVVSIVSIFSLSMLTLAEKNKLLFCCIVIFVYIASIIIQVIMIKRKNAFYKEAVNKLIEGGSE